MQHTSKILFLDIETAPNVAYVWGLFDQNISPTQVQTSSYVLCWAAKWHGEKVMRFSSVNNTTHRQMLRAVHTLLDEADIVVHYNGMKFDIPTLNKEFVKHRMTPPSPFKQIDLLRVCRTMFRFESNKLDSITQALDIGQKVKHHGFELWVGCMAGDATCWRMMERYNKMDVTLLEKVYHRLLPWIGKHPRLASAMNALRCPKCASAHTQRRGTIMNQTGQYYRYQCRACGGWFRNNKAITVFKGDKGVNL